MTEKRSAQMPTIDFSKPVGAPAFLHPSSIQWRVFKNRVALGIGGVAAVLLEFADARIRSGVWDHSVYRFDPIGRSERTGMAAMAGVYAPKETTRKLIAGITRMHAKVEGQTPKGEHYRALDPELLDWVGATAGYGFFKGYTMFARSLSPTEVHEFWNQGHDVARLYGVQRIPGSEAEFLEMMHKLAPRFEPHPIVNEFLQIIASGKAAPHVPKALHRAAARGAVAILPPVVRTALQLGPEWDLTRTDRLALNAACRIADRYCDAKSPHAQACVRLGLPHNFLYRSRKEQDRLLAKATIIEEPVAAATATA